MWKPITGFEGLYDVSETGYIRNARTLKVLKPNKIGKGYLIVHLKKGGKRYARYVHRLTAEAYVPNPHNHPVVNHDDGNKENCHYTNLIWSTYSENNQHAYDTGLKPLGEGQYQAILTEENVREIKRLGKYATFQEIADKYGVSKATIRDVLIGKTWRTIS